ncbi:MAG: AMP-binding protein, partial [Desulfomonilaceae bacterium]
MNLSYECVEKNASRIPTRLAMIDGERGTTFTYSEMNSQVNSVANGLISMGIKENDRVAIYLRNVPEFLVAFMAISKIGAIAVPFNIMLKKMEIEYILNHSESRVIFGMAEETEESILPNLGALPKLEKIIIVRGQPNRHWSPIETPYEDLLANNSDKFNALDLPGDHGLSILYTSGTTGKPKGVLSTHESWLSQAILNAGFVVPMAEEDGIITGAPLFHVYVVLTAFPTLYTGACFVTLERFFPVTTLELITKHKLTHFMGTPTMW